MQKIYLNKKGFTLIELLVVIAIIGTLSAIVLANLNAARNKSVDAAIKTEMSGLRSQAELYYDTNKNYGNISDCATGMFADTSQDGLNKAITKLGTRTTLKCTSDNTTAATKWAVSGSLKSVSTKTWCVDSSGFSDEITDATKNTGGECK